MDTEQLIQSLARDVAPVSSHMVQRRIGLGIAVGGITSLLLIGALYGFNPELDLAVQHAPFWIKWSYTLSLAVCAAVATSRLARPVSGQLGWLWMLALPVAALMLIGVLSLSSVPSAQWQTVWLGQSWHSCSRRIFMLSLPIFIGLIWSFRSLAPTRLRLAGASAGLTAGACSAVLYSLHCPEVSALFVLTWYSLGMLLATGAGALLGPRLLRW